MRTWLRAAYSNIYPVLRRAAELYPEPLAGRDAAFARAGFARTTDPALWHPGESDENVAVHLIIRDREACHDLGRARHLSENASRFNSLLDRLLLYTPRYNYTWGSSSRYLALGMFLLITLRESRKQLSGSTRMFRCHLSSQAVVWVLNASTRPYVDFEPSDTAAADVA